MRRSNPMAALANPYVVLADIMVSLAFILSLFLLSTTVYSEQMQRVAERNRRLKETSESLVAGLVREEILPAGSKPVEVNESKRRLNITLPRAATLLEIEDDGTLQRFRFPSGTFDFKRNTTEFSSPVAANAVLRSLAEVLLHNRGQIKSVVIEGYARPGEINPWPLSQARAAKIRAIWAQNRVLETVTARFSQPVFRWMNERKLWNADTLSEWHLQEYQARRSRPQRQAPAATEGVLPESWVIISGRGDSVQNGFVVAQAGLSLEFKIEYAERSAPPLDEILAQRPETREAAARANLIDPAVLKAARALSASTQSP